MTDYDVVIVGAGPYGLSAAAHLRAVKGLAVCVLGEPMAFWERYMPAGMLLRSPWAGSHIADPKGELTLDAYRLVSNNHLSAPVPRDSFINYGRWFQRQAVPDVDRRKMTTIEVGSRGFQLTLDDGETLKARRVVVATGIASFAWCPELFRRYPPSLVSHTSQHRDLSHLAGKEVVIIGGGQSALESAALLHEAGAQVEVAVRKSIVHWLGQKPWMHKGLIGKLLYAPPDVGPAMVSHLVARPNWFRRLPRGWQDRLRPRSIRPAGARWLKARLNGVPIHTGQSVVSAAPIGERIHLKFTDGTERCADHVLLGTGYRVNIAHYAFLSRALVDSIRRANGYPCLDAGFETSVRGLHFLGAPAAWSFGPLMGFVAGTEFASRALVRRILEEAPNRRN